MSIKRWGSRLKLLLAADTVRDKRIFLLAWPVMAEMFLQTLAQMVDMAMVGRLGQAAIAAVGLSFRPLFVGQAIFLGLGVATTAMVARFIGAKDREQATIAAQQSMLTTSILALVLALFGFFFARQITLFMGAGPDVVDLGVSYLRGFSPGIFFLMLATIMTAALRASGDTKTPFYAGAVSNAINVFGNYVLIFGHFGFPAMGVYGAAIATSFSRAVMAAILFGSLLQGKSGLHLKIKGFTYLDWDIISRLFRIGIPAALERLVQSVSMMLHLKILAALGTTAIAISTLSGNVEQLSFMPSIGFSVAAQTKPLNGQILEPKVLTSNIGVTLKADSLEKIETLNDDDVRAIFESSSPNQSIYFEFICEKDQGDNYLIENFSLKIEGNSNELDVFMSRFQKAKKTIIKFYNQNP